MEMLLVIQPWLYERKTRVAICGNFSTDMNIHNMVYQSAALRLPLWNVYNGDAALAVNPVGFLEIVFADALNCFKDFD